MKPKIPDVLIIGAGPAGIATSIQLARYGITPILIEKESIGGLLRNARLVENYPGFPDGISGGEIIALFTKQLRQAGAAVKYEEVLQLDCKGGWSIVTNETVYHPGIVVIASGTKPLPIPIDVPKKAQNKVFSEIWSLAKIKNQHVHIVGAGDAAFDYALNLADRENEVTILNRGGDIPCLPLLRERANLSPNIKYRENNHITKVEFEKQSGRLQLVTNQGTIDTDYLLFAIGREPQLDFLSENVKQQGQTLVESGKLYFAGDVHNGLFRQTAIATGEGLRTAMQIYSNRGAWK